jgi:hypothetical protein
MSTWQSKRRKNGRGRLQPSLAQLAEKRARADAKRMAEPRAYPEDHRAGEWRGYVLFVLDGVETRVELHQGANPPDRRSRSDSYEARVDGFAVVAGGLHAVARHMIAEMIPRSLARRFW